jgi:hypothetical protein
MFWVAWKGYNGGKAVSLGAVEQAEAEAYGMHGYPTAAQAQAKPNSVNAVEKTQVNAWIVAANDITGNPAADAEHAAAAAASAATGGNLATLESALTSKNTYIRIAKVVTGIVMIIVGLVKLTGTDSAVTKAAKGAVL